MVLKDVRFIPNLPKQLISVSQLDKERHHITFVNNAKSEKTGTLYLISFEEKLNTVGAKVIDSSLWNKTMDHLSERSLNILLFLLTVNFSFFI